MNKLTLLNIILESLNETEDILQDRLVPIPARSIMLRRSQSEEPQIKRVSSDFIPVPMVPVVAILDYIIDQIKSTIKYNRGLDKNSPSYISPFTISDLNRATKIFRSLKDYLVNSFPDQFETNPGSVSTIRIPSIIKSFSSKADIVAPMAPIVKLIDDLLWELKFTLKRNKGENRHEPWFISPEKEKIIKEAIRELNIFRDYLVSQYPDQF